MTQQQFTANRTTWVASETLTVAELAMLLHIKPATLRAYVRAGIVPPGWRAMRLGDGPKAHMRFVPDLDDSYDDAV